MDEKLQEFQGRPGNLESAMADSKETVSNKVEGEDQCLSLSSDIHMWTMACISSWLCPQTCIYCKLAISCLSLLNVVGVPCMATLFKNFRGLSVFVCLYTCESSAYGSQKRVSDSLLSCQSVSATVLSEKRLRGLTGSLSN